PIEVSTKRWRCSKMIASSLSPAPTFTITHGYTLLSAISRRAAALPFHTQIRQLFRELGMNHSLLDDNRQIISNRTRYYYRDRQHKLKNAPEVDNSYKWAGGGVLSTVDDLLIFANSML
uniref:Beta-lactamase-related domain-containing protein n=1 Tax=Parascaris univalens TaxID=6257 RepID=A0A915B8P9_PARUN